MINELLLNTIRECYPMLIIFMTVLIVVRLIYIIDNNEKFVLYEEFFNFMFILYALILYWLLTNTDSGNYGINIIPFKEILRYKIGSRLFIYNVIGNILIFMPFGFFVSRNIKAKKATHLLIGTGIISLTIETIQYHIGRTFDIDDIILNVVGALVGYLLYVALNAIKNHLPKFMRRPFFYNLICILILIIVVLYITRLFGFGWI